MLFASKFRAMMDFPFVGDTIGAFVDEAGHEGQGTWRPPTNDEERAQREVLGTSGTLRRIKRFARVLDEGVPGVFPD